MKKLCVLLAVLFSMVLCVEATAAFAEGGASPAADGVWLEYALNDPETDDDEKEILFDHWGSFLRGRLLEQGYEDVRVSATEGGAGIRVEVPGAADPDTVLAGIGQPPVLSFRYEDGTEFLTGRNLESAAFGYNDNWGSFYIELQLDAEGAEIFAEATGKSIDRHISISLDDEILMNPQIQNAITGGNIAITGAFTEEVAQACVQRIQAAAEAYRWTLVRTGTLQTAP